MLSHQTLKVVADSVNPSLGLLALVLPFLRWRSSWRPASIHIAVTLLTVALTYFLRAVLGLEDVWASWGMNFSTHTAICVVLAVALASLNWVRSWIWGAIFLAYAALMVYQGYHSWPDIGTTAAVVVSYTAFIRYCGARWSVSVLRSDPTTS